MTETKEMERMKTPNQAWPEQGVETSGVLKRAG